MQYSISLVPSPLALGDADRTDGPVEIYEKLTGLARTAEECGYRALWIPDHFAPPVRRAELVEEIMFECWAITAALARDTSRIRLGQTVTCNGYRNPALLAKMASTVDVISHGRLTLGLGAGDFEHEFRAYGYPWVDAPTRLRQLEEAIQIILALWTQREASFEGRYYQVQGAVNEPKGVQQPHIPLLIGGGGEKVTLKLMAKYADACDVVAGDDAALVRKLSVLKQHCAATGRDYESLHRVTRKWCVIRDTDEAAVAAVAAPFVEMYAAARRRHYADVDLNLTAATVPEFAIVGSPETIRRRIEHYADIGVQELQLFFADAAPEESMRLFATTFIA